MRNISSFYIYGCTVNFPPWQQYYRTKFPKGNDNACCLYHFNFDRTVFKIFLEDCVYMRVHSLLYRRHRYRYTWLNPALCGTCTTLQGLRRDMPCPWAWRQYSARRGPLAALMAEEVPTKEAAMEQEALTAVEGPTTSAAVATEAPTTTMTVEAPTEEAKAASKASVATCHA